MAATPHILIVGGGYVGFYTAYHLQRKLRRSEARVTVVDPQPNMTYQPFLPEAAAGAIEPRHVVVPLRRVLRHCEVLSARVTGVDHVSKVATLEPLEGDPVEISYDIIVMAAGSIARTLPIPGLATHGIGFRTVGEAIYLRNHVLSRLDIAATTDDAERRRRALTFVFVGGGYAGVEAFAELEDMARSALRYYPEIEPSDMHWMLVEAAERILPEVSKSLAVYTVKQMLRRNMDIRLATRTRSMVDGHVVLTDGSELDAETIVWTAGARANPLATLAKGFPVDDRGRIVCTPELRVKDVPDAWSAGDIAAVPDLSKKDDPTALCGPSAQHAVRQAKQLASNMIAVLRGNAAKPYIHAYAGSVASLGLRKGVAEIYGVKLRGWLAWFMHRTYHVSRVPTLNRKVRVVADWTLALFFRREAVSLGEIQNPRRAFESAARDH